MPVFYILVVFCAVLLLLCLSSLYKPIGKLAHRIWKDAKDNALDNNTETKQE